MTLLFLLFILGACGERYTPWETDVPSRLKDLTEKQLSRLNEIPDQSLPFTFAVLGDPQGTPHDLDRVVASINRREDVKFMMVLGDLTDYGLLHEYIWAGDALSQSRVPFLTVVGNHDAISHGKAIYDEMFGPFDYTFSFADIRFAMFNNNQFEFGRTDFTWLRNSVDDRTITASHIPPVIDVHDAVQIEHWTSINESAGIIGSLHGHRGTQTDQYWIEDNIPYYIVPKVSGVHYSLVTIDSDLKLSFQMCHSDCEDPQ